MAITPTILVVASVCFYGFLKSTVSLLAACGLQFSKVAGQLAEMALQLLLPLPWFKHGQDMPGGFHGHGGIPHGSTRLLERDFIVDQYTG